MTDSIEILINMTESFTDIFVKMDILMKIFKSFEDDDLMNDLDSFDRAKLSLYASSGKTKEFIDMAKNMDLITPENEEYVRNTVNSNDGKS